MQGQQWWYSQRSGSVGSAGEAGGSKADPSSVAHPFQVAVSAVGESSRGQLPRCSLPLPLSQTLSGSRLAEGEELDTALDWPFLVWPVFGRTPCTDTQMSYPWF